MATQFWLADEFYLTAHHDRTGRPRVSGRAVALGAGAALLGELMLHQRVGTRDGMVVVVNRQPPGDALTHAVLDQVIGEHQPHGVRIWLEYFARDALERIAGRLARTGVLTRVESRRLMRAEARWVPTDTAAAAMPGTLLRVAMTKELPAEDPTAALAGLVHAVGLDPVVLWGITTRTVQYRDWRVSTLPEPLRELCTETKVAVGNAVLTHRA